MSDIPSISSIDRLKTTAGKSKADTDPNDIILKAQIELWQGHSESELNWIMSARTLLAIPVDFIAFSLFTGW